MNKKFLSLFLCGALVSGSAGMFVSCKNYDSDIASLDDRITAVEKSVSEHRCEHTSHNRHITLDGLTNIAIYSLNTENCRRTAARPALADTIR